MARDNRRDAPNHGVQLAHKSQKKRKGTKYIHGDPASPPVVPGLLDTASLRRTCGGALLISPRGGFVFGGAFCLNLARVEYAISAVLTQHQRLRVVLECIGRRLCALVAHAQCLPFFGLRIFLDQYEIGVKYQPPGFNGFITAALFYLNERNVSSSDPEHSGYEVQIGMTRFRFEA